MKIIQTISVLVLLMNSVVIIKTLDLKPKCGYPGKPYQSKLNPEKLSYADGEVVSYECRHYWAAPQTRKCVNGDWIGPEARCADFATNLFMKDSRMFDMSLPVPKEMFHHTDMVITNTSWKYPNAFTSNRFKAARLAVHDDHEYFWQFNFTRPATKLYVKVNFNFLNFTLESEEVQRTHQFHVSVEISPYRTCVFQYQSRNEWRVNGIRYDTFFICEANSYEDTLLDAKSLPNYMNMRTKSSHNITYEFIALFFGTVYGTDDEPLCGEPPLRYGESSRANQEHRDYMIGCLDNENWYDASTGHDRKFNYVFRCVGDMIWNGSRPNCRPKKFCPLNGALSRLSLNVTGLDSKAIAANRTDKNKYDPHVIVDSILDYYHPIGSNQIYATAGTEVTYSCSNEVDYVIVGKETRKCTSDFKWNANEPICKSLKDTEGSKNTLLIVIVVMGFFLFSILIISAILFWICTKKMKLKIAQAEANKAALAAGDWGPNDIGLYDNIEMNGKTIPGDGMYEIYEHIMEPIGNEYTSYADSNQIQSNYDSISPAGAMGLPRMAPLNQLGTDGDYVRMLRDSARYEHLITDNHYNSNIRDDSFKRRNPEPSYLEFHK